LVSESEESTAAGDDQSHKKDREYIEMWHEIMENILSYFESYSGRVRIAAIRLLTGSAQ